MNEDIFFVGCLKTPVDTIYQTQTAKEFATTDKFTNMKKKTYWKLRMYFSLPKAYCNHQSYKSIECKLYWKQNKTSKTSLAKSPVII